jgi:Family of unknown function (DUF5522)
VNDPQIDRINPLVEGEDYYLEDGLFVFTSAYHLKRGSCCHSGCRHCPFGDTTDGKDQTTEIEKSPVRHSSCSADRMSDE